MKHINDDNGASIVQLDIAKRCLDQFKGPITGIEMGIAYGGGVEAIGKMWKDRGTVYGFDTFEGHPKQLSYSPESHEAYCMDLQYHTYGKEGLSYDFQRRKLDEQGLDNVVLRKGLVHTHSADDLPAIHYCLLDLDMVNPMIAGYVAVRDRIVQGGYLLIHDCVPAGHILGLWGLYQEIINTGKWELIGEYHKEYLVVLRRKRDVTQADLDFRQKADNQGHP
jgi:hypothetical protein